MQKKQPLSPEERKKIQEMITNGKLLNKSLSVEKAIQWSNEHPKTKPHFIVVRDKYTLIY